MLQSSISLLNVDKSTELDLGGELLESLESLEDPGWEYPGGFKVSIAWRGLCPLSETSTGLVVASIAPAIPGIVPTAPLLSIRDPEAIKGSSWSVVSIIENSEEVASS